MAKIETRRSETQRSETQRRRTERFERIKEENSAIKKRGDCYKSVEELGRGGGRTGLKVVSVSAGKVTRECRKPTRRVQETRRKSI